MKVEGWFVEFYGDVEDEVYVAEHLKQFLNFLSRKGKIASITHFRLSMGNVYEHRHRIYPFRFRFLPGKLLEFNPFFLKEDIWLRIELPPVESGVSALSLFETELWVVVSNVS